MAKALQYSKEALRERLLKRAQHIVGEATASFFQSVDKDMPVENGHAHETFGAALLQSGMPEVIQTASEMLSKGSGDPEAASRGSGKTKESRSSFQARISTSVGFVKSLEEGRTITPGDWSGNKGKKEPGTEGQLYGPRTDYGKGFLMWVDGGGKQFALSVNWGPMGFFERAAEAARETANNLGAV